MRVRILPPLAAAIVLAAPTAAQAAFPHVIGAGESLSSVAAADGLTVAQLAAANGLSTDSHLTAGSTLLIPPQTIAATSSAVASPVSSPAPVGDGDGDADDVGGPAPSSTVGTSPTGGSYL